jgi:hypothetical protein
VGEHTAKRARSVNQQAIKEIQQGFLDAGWDLDGSFEDHLVIGYSGDGTSILAHEEAWDTDNPFFELLDHETMLTYWVRVVPTPRQAQKLLEEYGEPPEEWDDQL